MRLLPAGQDEFIMGARDVLSVGLRTACRMARDDTGARHKESNGVCTQIGSGDFACSGAATTKIRLNILNLLRNGHTDCVINSAGLAHMRDHILCPDQHRPVRRTF